MAITLNDIKNAENDYQALLAQDPETYKHAKFIIDNDEIVIIGPKDPIYYTARAFNTPREVEHFTAGYGKEPGRSVPGKFIGSAVAPVTQHRELGGYGADKIRSRKRSLPADIGQDVLSDARYLLPALGALRFANPAGTAVTAGLGALGLGTAQSITSNLRDEPWYGDSPANIGLTAGAAALGAGAMRHFSKEQLRKRQLRKAISDNLALPEKNVDADLMQRVREGAEKGVDNAAYTFHDYKRQPLTDFDVATGAPDMQLNFKRLPMVYKENSQQVASRPIAREKRGKMVTPKPVVITDAMATKFVDDFLAMKPRPALGGEPITREMIQLDEVKDFLNNAWNRPLNEWGGTFFPTKATKQSMTKKGWTKQRANVNNNFVQLLLESQAELPDPDLNRQWKRALTEYGKRYKKYQTKEKTPIVSSKQYEKMGEYKLGKPIRPIMRYGLGALLPIATQVFGKYLLPTGETK